MDKRWIYPRMDYCRSYVHIQSIGGVCIFDNDHGKWVM